MYITTGVFNSILKQFEGIETDIHSILPIELKSEENLLEMVEAKYLASFLEFVTKKYKNHRIGLGKGVLTPVSISGILYSLYHNCQNIKEVFSKSVMYSPIANPIFQYSNEIIGEMFYHIITINSEFAEKYPIATRQLYESQCGITLQLLHSLTGRRIKPIAINSVYQKEGDIDKMERFFDCSVSFSQNKFSIVFNKSILELPVLTANKQLLFVVEKLISEMEIKSNTNLSSCVKRLVLSNITSDNLSLKSIALWLNMSKRNLQRKLKEEGTSYQEILNKLRVELIEKYMIENISFSEISLLLGFESQSALNKFFRKQFGINPRQYKKS